MYDDLDLNVEMLWDAFGENLEIASNGKSIGVSSLSRFEVAHYNHVSKSLSSIKHWVHESWSGLISS